MQFYGVRHLEIMPVTLSAAKGLARGTQRRDDRQDTSQARSREVLSPNVYYGVGILDNILLGVA